MSWPVLWYVPYDSIRTLLGVSDEEGLLSDAFLGGELAEAALHRALKSVSSDLPGIYAAIRDIPASERTEEEQDLAGRVPTLAALAVARFAASALPMAARVISDGKASVARFADGPYRDTLARIEEDYQALRTEIAEACQALGVEAAPAGWTPTLLSAARASVDRVTAE
jgi:hypothetical protein